MGFSVHWALGPWNRTTKLTTLAMCCEWPFAMQISCKSVAACAQYDPKNPMTPLHTPFETTINYNSMPNDKVMDES